MAINRRTGRGVCGVFPKGVYFQCSSFQSLNFTTGVGHYPKFFFFNFYIRDRNRDFMFTSVSGIFNKTALSNLTMRRIVDEKRNAQ